MKIECISKLVDGFEIVAKFIEAEKSPINDFFEKYPAIDIKEAFVPERTLFLRSASEANGALLYKAIEGTASSLLLDMRNIENHAIDFLRGFLLANWRFDKFQTQKEKPLEKLSILCCDESSFRDKFSTLQTELEGVYYARQLTSEPPNVMPPEAYGEELLKLSDLGIKVELLRAEEMKRLGMNALLGAGQGSLNAPIVAILHWEGAKDDRAPIALIGKGVCFDSGGLCLKPKSQQLDMRWDKAGAGVVAGVIKALAMAKTKVNVVGVLGLIENMPDGGAIKPGDILQTLSGQTVEIVDTDAEGRLVLADCLWYTEERFKPSIMIDLGTLTGETVACLGYAYAGLYTDDNSLADMLLTAGKSSGDLLWHLPMGSYFAKQLKSDFADMKNSGIDFCGENGSAAEFLKKFVRKARWAHIDIAGVSWTREELPFCKKGATGFGVRLLMKFVEAWLAR